MFRCSVLGKFLRPLQNFVQPARFETPEHPNTFLMPNFTTQIEHFEAHLGTERGLAENTVLGNNMIRRLTHQDRAALQTIRQRMMDEASALWFALDDSWSKVSDEDLDAVPGSNADTKEQMLFGVFDAGDALSAVAGLRRERRQSVKHKASLWGIYVIPERRRQGIGGRLVAALIQNAKTMPGLEMVRLAVAADNAQAVSLLRQQGFQTYAVQPRAYLLDGKRYDQAFLSLFLRDEEPIFAENHKEAA